MYIYKITNIINNKVYIGQTVRPIDDRFHRHIQDAKSNRLDTHLARAIRKYGEDNFIIEQIDEASSQEELTQKEHDWIIYYDSVRTGYNETDSMTKCGGNTYLSKTPEEMEAIKEKIRKTKLGGKNPAARKIKCKNIKTNEELFFDSMSEAQLYFNETNHQFVSRRCLNAIKVPYNNEWLFAYQENDYGDYCTVGKGKNKAKKVLVTNLETNEQIEYPSYAETTRQIGISRGVIQKRFAAHPNSEILFDKYKIQLLN